MKDRQASSIASDPSRLSHFGDEVRRGIVQSEIEGGVDLEELPAGTRLEVQTENRFYQIVNHGRGRALISGHPTYCPEAVEVSIHGSTWGGRMIKSRFIGRGMHLEFGHPEQRGVITTSRIVEIREQR
jgi:hypothetical protein